MAWFRITRGGSWNFHDTCNKISNYDWGSHTYRLSYMGFRIKYN